MYGIGVLYPFGASEISIDLSSRKELLAVLRANTILLNSPPRRDASLSISTQTTSQSVAATRFTWHQGFRFQRPRREAVDAVVVVIAVSVDSSAVVAAVLVVVFVVVAVGGNSSGSSCGSGKGNGSSSSNRRHGY